MSSPLNESDLSDAWRLTGSTIAAHVIGLVEAGMIDAESGQTLREGIARVAEAPPAGSSLLAMLAMFDERLDAQAGSSVEAAGAVGRGSFEVATTVARLLIRDRAIVFAEHVCEIRSALIDLAGAHTVTLLAVPVHGAAAQPTTVAHWLGGVIGPLARAGGDLAGAIELCDASAMGAGSLAGSALGVDRDAVAVELGLERVVANTFDAVSATDWIASTARALAAVATPIRRWLDELVDLARQENASVQFADEWLTPAPDLPQWRGIGAVDALARRFDRTTGLAATAVKLADVVRYGPVGWQLDELAGATLCAIELARECVDDARRLCEDGATFNRAAMANRSGRGFVSSSDLADFFMLEESVDPASARRIAALTVSRARDEGVEAAGITPELIDGAALLVLGRELKVEFEAISRYLAPRRFIERRSAVGTPATAATRTWLAAERSQLDSDRAKLRDRAERAARARQLLESGVAAID